MSKINMIVSILIVTFFLGITSAEYTVPTCPIEETPPCAVRCALLVQPICAVPKGWTGEPHTFVNSCTMAGYNCNCPSYPYKSSYDGECQNPCSKKLICPYIYKPICTLPDGFCGEPKDFSSQCELTNYNCINKQKYQFFHDGECIKKCADACLDIYKPVCALPDGYCGEPKVFGNSCSLSVHNCKEKKKYKYFHDGECLSQSKTTSKKQYN